MIPVPGPHSLLPMGALQRTGQDCSSTDHSPLSQNAWRGGEFAM